MNILQEVKTIITNLNILVETGVFKGKAPDTYVVLVPLTDTFPLNADDKPQEDTQGLRISIFSKTNYLTIKNRIVANLINGFFYISDRRFNGYDAETEYYQYTIDVEKNYQIEEEN